MATGGSIESVTINGRIFAVAADVEVQRKLGGFENEVQANGDGTARNVKTRVPWALSGLAVEVDDNRGDHEFLQDLSDRSAYVPVAITYASGVVYQGRGSIVGELQFSNQNSAAAFDMSGPGKLTPQ